MIVDDDPAGRDTLEALLFDQGYILAFAKNGEEALGQASHLKPDIILLDVMMPGMDGYEVCRKLRENPEIAEIPVLMITALDGREAKLDGIEAGADDFISKPFDRVELRARIKTITRLGRYRQLHLERSKFEWVVDQSDDGYLVINNQDDILYANSQAYFYLKLNPDKTITESFSNVGQKQYRLEPAQAWEGWPEIDIEPSVPLYLVQPATATTNSFWLQVEPLRVAGQSETTYLLRLRDVTERIIEQRSQWAFHSQVSHKLRTPLSIIDGFLDLFVEDETLFQEAEAKRYLSMLRNNSVKLRENIVDIFEYMKVSDINKRGQSATAMPDLVDIVNEVRSEMGHHSSLAISPDMANPAVAAPLSDQAVRLIFRELFENAEKFHPNHTPTIDVKITNDGSMICFQIIDDGLGLTSRDLKRIWSPYYQMEKQHSGQVPGMGLGLSMIASLVWSAGGSCQATPREDRDGLVIELKLPVSTIKS